MTADTTKITLPFDDASMLASIALYLSALIDRGDQTIPDQRAVLSDEQFVALGRPFYRPEDRDPVAARLRTIAVRIEEQLPPEALEPFGTERI